MAEKSTRRDQKKVGMSIKEKRALKRSKLAESATVASTRKQG